MKIKVNGLNCKCQADPFILEEAGVFYIFTTGVEGVKCYHSNELLGEYTYDGIVYSRYNFKEYWAPAVIKIDGVFYMYVSCMPEEEEDTHTQRLIVASSKKLIGPYEFLNELCMPFSIDAHPVLNDSGLYLFYSINEYEGEKVGTRIVVDKMVSPTEASGNPIVVVKPSIEEEIYMKNRFKDGQDWYTIEGACYFKDSDCHYLLYSANCYQNKYYFVGYSICKSNESDLTKLDFKKYPNENTYSPLLARNDFESGTGHNSVINYQNHWYIVYHGRDIEEENETYDNRSMRIGKLSVEDGNLQVIRNKDKI